MNIETFGKDHWGRPFRLERVREPGITRVRVLSDGANGIAENGEGDDLYVEVIVFDFDNSVKIKLKRILEHGRIMTYEY
jgi:hypothetical protein